VADWLRRSTKKQRKEVVDALMAANVEAAIMDAPDLITIAWRK
jgi:hypothetical protein